MSDMTILVVRRKFSCQNWTGDMCFSHGMVSRVPLHFPQLSNVWHKKKKKVIFWFSWWRTSDIPRQHFQILICISSRSPMTLEGHQMAPHWNWQKLLIWLVSHLNCHWVHGPGTLQMMVPLSDSWREVPVSNLRISVGAVSSSSVLRASMRYAVHPVVSSIRYITPIELLVPTSLFLPHNLHGLETCFDSEER